MAEPTDTSPANAAAPQISPPYAYSEIVPLNKNHRVLVPQRGKIPPTFRSLSALPVSLAEFPVVSRDYPIVFVSADGGKTHAAFAVLGLEQGRNLFLMSDATWDRRAYLPAYVRRYPFCMATITVDGRMREERLVCVEKKALRDKGDQLFDDAGKPLPEWEQQQKLLIEYEADLVRTNEMCATLASLGLLEPFTMQARPNEGTPLSLSGTRERSEARGARGRAGEDAVDPRLPRGGVCASHVAREFPAAAGSPGEPGGAAGAAGELDARDRPLAGGGLPLPMSRLWRS